MAPYIISVVLITVLPFLAKNKTESNRKRAKKIICLVSFAILLFIMGFRNESLGMEDTEFVYHPWFNTVSSLGVKQLFETLKGKNGVLIYFLMKIFQVFSKDYNAWIFFSSIPFLASYIIYVYKRCEKSYECMFSIIFMVYIRIYTAGFYLQRHFIAMAFFIIAYDALLDKKYRKYIVFSLLAFFTHPTALVAFLLYPLSKFKLSGKQSVLLIVAYFSVLYAGKDIFNTLFTVLSNSGLSYYTHYTSRSGFSSNTLGLVMILLLIMFYVIIKLFKINDNYVTMSFNVFAAATIFTMSASFVEEMYRIGYFFTVCSIPGYARSIGLISKKNNRWVCYVALYVLLCVYYWPLFSEPKANLYPYISMFH